MEVMVEILLSLLAQPSHLMRQVARNVFGHICPHLTPHALQLVLDVSWDLWEVESGVGLPIYRAVLGVPYHPLCPLL